MERLLNFVYSYRAFFIFLSLESFCGWLIVQNNTYQSAAYFSSSNAFIAQIHAVSYNIREYFSLTEINASLAKENSLLRKKIEQQKLSLHFLQGKAAKDSALINQYNFISAKVVNNSTKYYKNFITIDKGINSGLKPGMAVTSANHVVGKVKSVSSHYSVLISILNLDEQISCLIKRTGHFGTIQWNGVNPLLVNLKYIPRHVKPIVGDSIITSNYNAVFPFGIFIGKIKEIKLNNEALFYDIKVELGIDMNRLSFVEVVKSNLKKERDSLEIKTTGEPK